MVKRLVYKLLRRKTVAEQTKDNFEHNMMMILIILPILAGFVTWVVVSLYKFFQAFIQS